MFTVLNFGNPLDIGLAQEVLARMGQIVNDDVRIVFISPRIDADKPLKPQIVALAKVATQHTFDALILPRTNTVAGPLMALLCDIQYEDGGYPSAIVEMQWTRAICAIQEGAWHPPTFVVMKSAKTLPTRYVPAAVIRWNGDAYASEWSKGE